MPPGGENLPPPEISSGLKRETEPESDQVYLITKLQEIE